MAVLVNQFNDFYVSHPSMIVCCDVYRAQVEKFTSFRDPNAYRPDFLQKVSAKSEDGKFTDEELRELLGAREGEELACTSIQGYAYVPEGEHVYMVWVKYSQDRPENEGFKKGLASDVFNYTERFKYRVLGENKESDYSKGIHKSINAFMSSVLYNFDEGFVYSDDKTCRKALLGSADKHPIPASKVEEYLLSDKVILLQRSEYDGRHNIRKENFQEEFDKYKKKFSERPRTDALDYIVF